MIDIERLVSDYLRDQEIRVVGKPPKDRDSAWVMVTMLASPKDPTSTVDWLIAYLVQLDCYAGASGGQPEANDLASEVWDAIEELPQSDHDIGVVTATRSSAIRQPDVEFEPARDRVIIRSTIHAHPLNGGS